MAERIDMRGGSWLCVPEMSESKKKALLPIYIAPVKADSLVQRSMRERRQVHHNCSFCGGY